MLLVLPPSETKRDGGEDDSALDLTALGYSSLTPLRSRTIAALRSLSRNVAASTAALHLGATQRFEIDRNRALTTSPVMPAIERYTGVLYDGLDAASMTPVEREFASDRIAISSALFGLLRASDPIPAYRLSHNSRLPGMPLRKLWSAPVSAAIAAHDGLILDLRSESYTALGPAPDTALYVRVVSENAQGRRVALSHFNKHGKGEFARSVIAAGIDHGSVESLLAWAASAGIRLEHGAPGELELVAS
jgi:cytoplasmic iron level regulating protein YaaA (DUF328/UPF0246 family)